MKLGGIRENPPSPIIPTDDNVINVAIISNLADTQGAVANNDLRLDTRTDTEPEVLQPPPSPTRSEIIDMKESDTLLSKE